MAIKKLNSIFDTESKIIQFMGSNKYIITKNKCWPVFKQDPCNFMAAVGCQGRIGLWWHQPFQRRTDGMRGHSRCARPTGYRGGYLLLDGSGCSTRHCVSSSTINLIFYAFHLLLKDLINCSKCVPLFALYFWSLESGFIAFIL